MITILWLVAAAALGWIAWEIYRAPEVDEGNCPVQALLEHGRSSPCRIPPPCTEHRR